MNHISSPHPSVATIRPPIVGKGIYKESRNCSSCALIRVHYSTLFGTAVAYERYQYWNEWGKYLAVKDSRGVAKFFKRGIPVFKSEATEDLKKVRSHMDAPGIRYKDLDSHLR